jgi:hypothetical protein
MVAACIDPASREWAAIGEVAPLLLAAGTPKAPHLRIHTINTNRLAALIPPVSSGIVRRPAPCDRRGDLIGEHHRKGSKAGAPTARNPPARFSFPPRFPCSPRNRAARTAPGTPIVGRRRRKRGRTKAADLRYRIEAERGE